MKNQQLKFMFFILNLSKILIYSLDVVQYRVLPSLPDFYRSFHEMLINTHLTISIFLVFLTLN